MDKFFDGLFNSLGKKYEVLVYERARRQQVAAQRDALKLGHETDPASEYRLQKEIQLTERLMAAIAAARMQDNDI